jgi:hypothetical protein
MFPENPWEILLYNVIVSLLYRVYKKNATLNFLRNQFAMLKRKDFRPLGIEIELLIDHIAVIVH